jgi:hypothetical protein
MILLITSFKVLTHDVIVIDLITPHDCIEHLDLMTYLVNK